MKRREFIAALGGAAAWPVAARTQPTGKSLEATAQPLIDFLNSASPDTYRLTPIHSERDWQKPALLKVGTCGSRSAGQTEIIEPSRDWPPSLLRKALLRSPRPVMSRQRVLPKRRAARCPWSSRLAATQSALG
jgi:hypothetical protein